MAENAPPARFQRSLVSKPLLLIAQYETGNHSNCSLDEHEGLLDAIESGDEEQAVELMKETFEPHSF